MLSGNQRMIDKILPKFKNRNKEEDSEFLVKKLNSVQKEKEDFVAKYEELLKTKVPFLILA